VDDRGTPTAFEVDEFSSRLAAVKERIATAGDPEAVTIVAVTKGQDVTAALTARAAGCRDFGENYAGELVEKAEALAMAGGPLRWHLIGGIQRRSISRLAPYVALYQSVDRESEADAIARHAKGAAVLIEVDTTGIAGRGGVPPEGVGRLAEHASKAGLDVQGLMTVAPTDDPAGARRSFRTLRQLVDLEGLRVCSMGMSDDFVAAVEEGSTMVRLGRVLFGPRPTERAVSQ
jgi:PLP dependent protein